MGRSSLVSGTADNPQVVDTVVVGGGQAGLAAGYFLARERQHFIILDENPRTGSSWRNRWDSLRLFTPTQFNGLPGFPFPGPDNVFPVKDEVADYLESYVARFDLPVRCNARVEKVSRRGDVYYVSAGGSSFAARNVIIASGPYRIPAVPAFAGQLSSSIQQMHSMAYRNPSQVPQDAVLVVGAGNSGAEIALELANHGKRVWLAGRDVGRLVITQSFARIFGGRPFWWLANHILTVDTPMGRRARKNFIEHGHPLGRARREDLVAAGIELVPRMAGVESGKPRLEDGRVLPVESVIWATGYHASYDWIDLPIFSDSGQPRHHRGVVDEAPGLYFLGLPFQNAISSSLLGGVGRDAAYIAKQIAGRATA
jgi:putative flavoprotein involved in K+ transport